MHNSTTPPLSEAKELTLPNYNNCLACEAFIQINIAPKESIPESALNRLYHVKHEGHDHFMKLVDLLRIDFKDVNSTMTLPATGLEAHEWRAWWLDKYPNTKPDTKMAVYYYKKHKEESNGYGI